MFIEQQLENAVKKTYSLTIACNHNEHFGVNYCRCYLCISIHI